MGWPDRVLSPLNLSKCSGRRPMRHAGGLLTQVKKSCKAVLPGRTSHRSVMIVTA